MGRTRSHTRRHPRSNPRGVLSVRGGGFGFVQTAEGEFFVPESKMAGAFDGDLVEVAPLPVQSGRKKQPHERKADLRAGEKPAARVLRVVDRAHDTLVGRYEVAEPFGVVVPEDANIPYDIFTMRADRPDIEDGSLVRVRITTFPSRNTAATGVIEEVLGLADDEHAAVDVVIARHKLETVFSEGALSEARSAVLDEDGALASGYRDLRERFTFTIDPADARDFDDAVSLEPVSTCGVGTGIRVVDERGLGVARWRLGVHIADVAHYVPWNSSLDLDARRRATSVYLVDRVIPMLPDELSGDLCSLKPDEVRRTMTADLYLDDRARLVAYDLYPALIRSHARLSYEEAQALLDRCHPERSAEGAESKDLVRRDGACAPGDGLSDRLAALSRLAKQRFASRERAGGLDFDSVEARVVLDEEGSPTGIDLRVKTDATSLIEEAMILANETVAKHLRDAKFPSLYRVHEQPSADSLAALVPVFQDFAWFRDIDQADFIAGDAHVVQRVLEASAERPEGELVSTLLLRSMKRAVYRPDCAAHYGLASGAYTHFTSPIRRYPDLVVHRMLKALIGGRPEKFDPGKIGAAMDRRALLRHRAHSREGCARVAGGQAHRVSRAVRGADVLGDGARGGDVRRVRAPRQHGRRFDPVQEPWFGVLRARSCAASSDRAGHGRVVSPGRSGSPSCSSLPIRVLGAWTFVLPATSDRHRHGTGARGLRGHGSRDAQEQRVVCGIRGAAPYRVGMRGRLARLRQLRGVLPVPAHARAVSGPHVHRGELQHLHPRDARGWSSLCSSSRPRYWSSLHFYTIFPFWDALLHTFNGFLAAAIGLALVSILNRSDRIAFSLSPFFCVVVAFCFSMTIGVLWEFFEFGMDEMFGLDMQKDTVMTGISSTLLDPSGSQHPQRIDRIESVEVNGQELGVGGYLDIGLRDTMGDLFVNFVGALAFSVIGYRYLKSKGEGRFVRRFVPTPARPTMSKL